MAESIGKAYKPWLILSLVVLVGSLLMLAVVMTLAFLSYSDQDTPIWIIVLAVLSAMGVALGFGGFFLMMLVAGWRSAREARRVQVIPLARTEG